jgi:hypothetical protein
LLRRNSVKLVKNEGSPDGAAVFSMTYIALLDLSSPKRLKREPGKKNSSQRQVISQAFRVSTGESFLYHQNRGGLYAI